MLKLDAEDAIQASDVYLSDSSTLIGQNSNSEASISDWALDEPEVAVILSPRLRAARFGNDFAFK